MVNKLSEQIFVLLWEVSVVIANWMWDIKHEPDVEDSPAEFWWENLKDFLKVFDLQFSKERELEYLKYWPF